MALREYYQEWLEHDGKTVVLFEDPRHIAYRIKVAQWEVIYPYHHQAISVYAEVRNKGCKFYRDMKRKLGDDWSTDVLASSPEIYADILRQCRNQSGLDS